jgi:hypothetical protein
VKIGQIETRSLPALTRSYPRSFTFYVAPPARSIQRFGFALAAANVFLSSALDVGRPAFSESLDSLVTDHASLVTDFFSFSAFSFLVAP